MAKLKLDPEGFTIQEAINIKVDIIVIINNNLGFLETVVVITINMANFKNFIIIREDTIIIRGDIINSYFKSSINSNY